MNGRGKIIEITGFRKRHWRTNLLLISMMYAIIMMPASALFVPEGYVSIYDGQSLFALLGNIFVNSIGDFLSIFLSIRLIENAASRLSRIALMSSMTMEEKQRKLWKNQIALSLMIAEQLASIVLMVAVLSISSVLFAFSVNEISFSNYAVKDILEWIARWPKVIITPYISNPQFGVPEARFPGLFLFGITSFIPSVLITLISLFWILTIPIRIVGASKRRSWVSLFTVGLCTLAICIFAHYLGQIFSSVYVALSASF